LQSKYFKVLKNIKRLLKKNFIDSCSCLCRNDSRNDSRNDKFPLLNREGARGWEFSAKTVILKK
jgi:hypothetical protein